MRLSLSLSLSLSLPILARWIVFSHHSEQMFQRSQVSKIVLSGCSLNVFVIVIVFVFVFVFVLLKKCERVAVKGCIDQFHAMGLRKCQSTNRKYDIEKYSW